MTRPWTAIATVNATGLRKTVVFEGNFDMTRAASDFDRLFNSMRLEALIPGVHNYMYIRGGKTKIIPKDQLFSGF